MTRVWPALWPPWKRTTTSACSDNQSTILPFPSSPHCEPTTTTLAMDLPPSRRKRDKARRVLARALRGLNRSHPGSKPSHPAVQRSLPEPRDVEGVDILQELDQGPRREIGGGRTAALVGIRR